MPSGAPHRDAGVGADAGRDDERVLARLRRRGGVGDELRRLAGDHRVAPGVLAREREAGAHAAVLARVAVDVAQHQLGLAQLGEVRQLHPEHLASGCEQTVHRSRIGSSGRSVKRCWSSR